MRAYLLATTGLGALGGATAIVQAFCLSQAVSGVFLGGQTPTNVELWLWMLLAAMLARSLVLLLGEVAAARAAGEAKLRLRAPFLRKLLSLGPAFTRDERSGELVSVASDGVETLDAYFSQYLPQMFNTMIMPAMVAVVVFSVDALSGVALLLTAPVLPIFMILVGKLADAQARKQWRTLSAMSAHFLDTLSGLTTLKLFGRSLIQKEKVAAISSRHRDTTMSVLRVAFLSALILEIAAAISTAVIAVQIGLRLLYGGVSFAPAFFVLLLAPEFYIPFRMLGAKFHAAMAGGEAASRMLQIMSIEPASTFSRQPVMVRETALRELGRDLIRFENVTYSYDPASDLLLTTPKKPGNMAGKGRVRNIDNDTNSHLSRTSALQRVSFQIETGLGKSIAFVGPSGGGKSTIVSLLLRFVEPSAGTIYVGERPLTDYAPDEWRKLIAWVPQRPYLFHSSVEENIRLGKPDATRDEVEWAARTAHAHDFIVQLPQGYKTLIGERGTRLSGGQAQRIGLARAFIKNAPLLILDEATSQLDAEHAHQVMESVRHVMKERTTIIIAHHLATVQNASCVFVLDGGRIVEAGDHESLIEQRGIYRDLLLASTGQVA